MSALSKVKLSTAFESNFRKTLSSVKEALNTHVGTNLIQDLTTMAFSMKLAVSRAELIDFRFMSHPTQNRSFWRCSSQPISWLSTVKLNQAQRKQTCIHNNIYYNIKWTP